jgi:dynein heavy chain
MVPENQMQNVIDHVVFVHKTVEAASIDYLTKLRRTNFVTPKNYLDFAQSYLRLLEEKDDEVERMCVRLEGGLKKIAEAQVQLDDLNAKLVVQKVVVKEKSEACAEMLIVISESTKIASVKQEEAETKAVEIEKQR